MAAHSHRKYTIIFLLAGLIGVGIALTTAKPSFMAVICLVAASFITTAAVQLVRAKLDWITCSKILPRTEYLWEPLTLGPLIFKTDETAPLKHWMLDEKYQKPSQISVVDMGLKFVTPPQTMDEWDYIFLNPVNHSWVNFSWHLKFRRQTTFREYAFNFRYQDFDNRYRYRFEDDKIFFDKKVRGDWVNNIASLPFPMELGRWYDLRIDAYATLFRCYVDGRLCLENSDTDLANGSVCLILWEDDGKTEIIAEIGPSKVFQLIAGSITNMNPLAA